MRAAVWLTLTLTLACRESRSGLPETGRPDVAARTGSADLEDSEPGVEFEAPRLIPGIRAQISRIREPDGATEENITAFRNGVSDLVSAMQADLQRVGVTDTGTVRELSDSVLREFGGGTGTPAGATPEEARALAAQVERLTTLYEERMRAGVK
ncbi:MAG TPA: hypothetical protein VH764_09755 [Gemmatimonadales bacterium]|jgi:hypothetical protein